MTNSQESSNVRSEGTEATPLEVGPPGTYANFMRVSHTLDEFTLEFGAKIPGTKYVALHARIISSPTHAKRMLRALQENIRKYEERFGELPGVEEPARQQLPARGR